MSTLNVKTDDETLNKLMVTEILKHMSPDIKENLTKTALEHILGKPSYGREMRVVDTLRNVIDEVGKEVCREVLAAHPKLRETIRDVYVDALKKTFEDDRQATVDRIADAMLKNLIPSR